jgi:hypothetical protein
MNGRDTLGFNKIYAANQFENGRKTTSKYLVLCISLNFEPVE